MKLFNYIFCRHQNPLISSILAILFVFSPAPLHAQKLVVADELVVSVPQKFPPYFAVNEDGALEGFGIDVFEAVAKRAGIRYRYDIQPEVVDTLRQVENGKADIIPNLGITSSRLKYLNYTSPVSTFPIGLFTRTSNETIKTSTDLSNRKVAVVKAESAGGLLRNIPGVEIHEYSSFDLAFQTLISGQTDAMAYPEPVFLYLVHDYDLEDKVHSIKPYLGEIKRGIAVRKDLTSVLQDLDVALQAYINSAAYNNTYKKWFEREQEFWDTRTVFWSMSGLTVFIVIGFLIFRHIELVKLNANLQKEIDLATEQLSESNEYLQDLTVTDTLTGINNRRAFEIGLNDLMNRAHRYGHGFSMMILDVDDFKSLNDQYGHDAGDVVLTDLVNRISEIVRDVDILCRWGGEEFTILMPQTLKDGALKMAERCRRKIADDAFDEAGLVTISVGVTSYSKGDSERSLFKRADDALYQAKSNGKNQVVWMGGDE
jgi:diguanylate cyclase (GGDEF)-like protein